MILVVISVIVVIALYMVFIILSSHNMYSFSRKEKIITMAVGIVFLCFITILIVNITTPDISFKNEVLNEKMKSGAKNIIAIVFVPINGIILLPFLTKTISQYRTEEITKKKALIKGLGVIFIFVLCLWFEKVYIAEVQDSIIKMFNIYT